MLDQAGPFWPAIPHQLEDRSKLNHPLLDAGMGQRGSTTTWPLRFFLCHFWPAKIWWNTTPKMGLMDVVLGEDFWIFGIPIKDGLSNQNVDAGSNYVKRHPTWTSHCRRMARVIPVIKWWINWLFLWEYPFYKWGELVLVLITTPSMECIIPKLNYNWIHHKLN